MNDLPEIFKNDPDINELEEAMKALPQVQEKVDHHFAEGVYVRTLFIPKGTLLIGKRHRLETCNMIVKGDISIYMGPGLPVRRFIAPCIFNSNPGTKKLGYAHEDTYFVNIHPTELKDLEQIEHMFIIPEKEYLEAQGELCLG